MIDFDTQVLGFDLETQGTLPEYALQPWRASQNLAQISAVAYTKGDVSQGRLYPSTDSIKAVLERAVAQNMYVCGWNVTFDVAWLCSLGLEDLAFRVKWLDSMLLWRHLDVEPEGDDVPKNKRRSYSLETAMHTFFPDEAGFKEFTNFQTTDPGELQKLLFRCKEDTRFAVRLGAMFWEQLGPAQRQAALIEARCIPQVAMANVRGIWSSRQHAEVLQTRLEKDGASIKVELLKLCPGLEIIDSGVKPKALKEMKKARPDTHFINLGSPLQLAELLYDIWGLPCLKQTKGTAKNPEGNRSTDKYVLYELAFKDPRARMLKEVRECKNNCTKYAVATQKSLDYNGDGYIRPQARIFSTYCVPGDVEVLTRSGWERLDAWGGGEIVQAHPDGRLEFLPATQYVGGVERNWVDVNHNSLKCSFTENHTVPHISQKYCKWSTTTAAGMLKHRGSSFAIPISGQLNGISGPLTTLQMRILCMAQADGWFSKDGFLKFTFKKVRKISRAILLLSKADINHRVRNWPSYPDRVEITIPKTSLPAWLTKDCKLLGPWLLGTSPAGLRAFVNEVVHWDGSINADDGVDFSSSIKSNAEWIDTLAHLTGFKSAVHAEYKGIYEVHISSKKQRPVRTLITYRHLKKKCLDQQAYCATTETGFWLARSNGSIFITGNSGRMTYASNQKLNKKDVDSDEVLSV